MKKNQGSATIILTASLLFIALIFSLNLYKQTSYVATRAENEAYLNQVSWAAEGALECAIALLQSENSIDETDFSDCEQLIDSPDAPITTELNVTSTDDQYLVQATSKNNHAQRTITQTFKISKSQSEGAPIVARSNLHITASIDLTPAKGNETDEGWECIAFVTDDKLSFQGSIVNDNLYSSAEEDTKYKKCKSDYITINHPFKKDFVIQPKIKPFEDFFGVSYENHNDVKKTFDYHITTKNSGNNLEIKTSIQNCGSEIFKALQLNKRKIWVEGHCEISNIFSNYTQELNGVLLVLHDGIVNFPANFSNFYGYLFHFNYEYKHDTENWKLFSSFQPTNKDNVFHVNGSIIMYGSLLLDTQFNHKKQKSIVNGSAIFRYRKYNDLLSGNGGNHENGGTFEKGPWHDWS